MQGRVAAAPISWGVCEVPGWGDQLPADRALAEMADTILDGPPRDEGPVRAVRESLDYLRGLFGGQR